MTNQPTPHVNKWIVAMTTKGVENVCEYSFVLFVFFVVKRIFGCGRRLRCVRCSEQPA